MRAIETRSSIEKVDPKIRKMQGMVNEPSAGGHDVLDPQVLFAGLWRRKSAIIASVLLFLALALLVLSQVQSVYTADLSLLIQGKQNSLIEFSSDRVDSSINSEVVASEIEVIRSRRLAQKVIEELQLANVLEFNPDANNTQVQFPGFFEWLKARLSFSKLNFRSNDVSVDVEVRNAEILHAFSEKLRVSVKGQSRVLGVTFKSVDPERSASVVNALADFYIAEQLELKTTTSDKTLVELLARIKPLQQEIELAESELVLMRRDAGLVGGAQRTLDSQQLAGLNNEISKAQGRYLEARARLRQAKRALKSSDGGSIPAVLKSSTINRLLNDKAEIQRQIDELSVEYGRSHPAVVQLQSKVQGLKENIHADVARVVSALANEVGIAQRNLSSLKARMEEVTNQSVAKSEVAVQYYTLEREVVADRALLEALLARLREVETQSNVSVQQADARVISYATVPLSASFPRKGSILVLTLFIGLVVGIIYVLVTEAIDHGFRDIALIEKQTGVAMIGFVPDVARIEDRSDRSLGDILAQRYKRISNAVRDMYLSLQSNDGDAVPKSAPLASATGIVATDSKALLEIILSKKRSQFSDAVHAVYSGLRLQNGGRQPRSILISSTQTAEGKSTLASCIATARAQNGDRVVIIDTDLRKANLNRIFGVSPRPGVVDYFSGISKLDEIIQCDSLTGVDVIAAGHSSDSFVDVLFSDQFDTMLTALVDRYDLVILDSPPVLEAQDAKILATKVDQTLFVVKWGETKRKHVRQAIDELQVSRSNAVGLLVNCVDVNELATYGYGGAGYGYGLESA